MALEQHTRMFSGLEINRATASTNPRVVAPLTGDTISLGFDDRVLFINPAGTIAALTIKLPVNPVQGSIVTMSFNQIVTALTVQDGIGNAVQSTSGAVKVGQEYRYIGAGGIGWVRWI